MKGMLVGTVLLLILPTIGLAAEAGSGKTNGAASTKDAGSGPTPGAKPGTGTGDSTGTTTGPKTSDQALDAKPKASDQGKKIAP